MGEEGKKRCYSRQLAVCARNKRIEIEPMQIRDVIVIFFENEINGPSYASRSLQIHRKIKTQKCDKFASLPFLCSKLVPFLEATAVSIDQGFHYILEILYTV